LVVDVDWSSSGVTAVPFNRSTKSTTTTVVVLDAEDVVVTWSDDVMTGA